MKTAEEWNNLVEMFLDQTEELQDKPLLWAKKDGAYRSQSWTEVASEVAKLAWSLKEQGVGKGDRVALISENRPEFCIADLAIMSLGAITVPTYTTNTTRDHEHILDNSGAKGAIISTARLSKHFLPAAHEADSCRFVVCMEPPRISQSLNVEILLWEHLMMASKGKIEDLRAAANTYGREDLACLIYTSGTGGAPKGVMTHHGGILHNCAGAREVLEELGVNDEVFLSFLPLSHAYEHTGGQFLPLTIGAQIYYAEGLDKLATNMAEARPTIMTVVPRLFELLRGRITRSIQEKGGLSAKLFQRTLDLGTKRFKDPSSLTWWERQQNKLLDKLVRKKVQQRFGGRIKALISGGAPLNPDVGLFFHALDLRLLQGYGQTENSPVSNVNRPSQVKIHTVGPPLKDTEIRIAEDGEILLRGELVMKGYWQDEEATARALEGGWLHTGDVGRIDEDGHLEITDRKKDILINDKGDNVSPQRIEGMLTLEPEIAQAMIYGDRKPHMVALLVPDQDWLNNWAGQNGKSANLAELEEDADLHHALDEAVSRVNKRLSAIERVRRFRTAREPFTIDNEQMTPTMKIRRHVITAAYRDQLEGMY